MLTATTLEVISLHVAWASICYTFLDPEKRLNGMIQYVGLLTLLVCAAANALDRLDVIDIS